MTFDELVFESLYEDEMENQVRKPEKMSFYYITSFKNVDSIFNKGIFCRERVEKDPNIKFEDFSDKDIQQRRKEKGLHKYVPLFINPRNALLYRYLKEGRNVVILEIDSEVANQTGTLISYGNASSKNAEISIYTKQTFESLNFDDIFSIYWWREPKIKSITQSEILIPEIVDKKYIKNVYTFSGENKRTLENKEKIDRKKIKTPKDSPIFDMMFQNELYIDCVDL
jgi:hypothetical protein